ncbi:MmgE/PrpD family-domain-containing protein [Truncatella angustata]|uniref:MmgE/PrpD family-domain-containing protein n=1 Tax=Truncatella angustata TaxID=152316 RepID=A0A9P9A0T3_9PEZI|nr:MmgE/PrpD family-domain-containing protein [Truncatella angustata]KAH6658757.1 MmgE/PrpD family-domain-containing protein [Truncatella angustata]
MSIPKYDQLLSDVIAYVYHTEISSPLAYKRARVALLDSLGCAIETLAQSSEARAFIGPVVPGTKVPNGFKLPGTAFALDPVKGAFDLGALIRYLDHNDAYPGAEWGHPSDNLGAIIAVADWLSRSYAVGNATEKPITMKQVLTAQIKAYEIQGVLQIKNSFNQQGLDHTILVKVASTAVVAHLMGLSEGQALSALSHAWLDGHPLRTFRQAPNVGPRKGWAAGDACTRAVHLCFLAMAGQPGTPSVLTASKWGFQDVLFRGQEIKVPRPYGTFVIEYHFFKLVVAEGHGISAAEAAVELATRLKVVERTVGDIEKMTIRTQQAAKTIIDKTGPLRNPADRDHCIQYIVAVSLMKGSFIDSEDYSDDSPWASDPRVDQLREKMVVVEDEQFTKDYHDHKVRSAANAVKIDMKTGENIPEVVVEFPIGHPKHTETLDLVKRKFEANMRQGGFKPGTVDEIINLVENDDIPIHHLIDLFEKDVRYG